ncbi:MAG TPA: hypothetical protein VD731_01290 [Nitrosopumilaceae archaeon]|nr:hypothetical protein [Nitrosopumilaceae archaeon]
MSFEKKSNFWFLLPILLGLIGGIIAFFVLRKDDPRKAKNCLYLGIILFGIGIIINLAIFGTELPIKNNFGVNL